MTAFDALFAIYTGGTTNELDVEAAFEAAMGYKLDRVVLRVLLKKIDPRRSPSTELFRA